MPFFFRYVVPSLALLLILGGAIWALRGGAANRPPVSTFTTREQFDSRPSPVKTPVQQPISRPWFATRTNVGIDFRHDSGTSPEKPFPSANGSGIAAFDYDLDERCDLYFVTGTPFSIDPLRRPINRFFRNLGAWQFQDVTRETGLGHDGFSAGVTFGDYNCDGFPDIYVACYGTDQLYRNMGDGTFAALAPSSGAADERWATSAAMLDYDADGLLDIYICNYGKWTLAENEWCGDKAKNIRFFCSPQSIPTERDTLLQNRGDDTFEDATEAAGVAQPAARAQGVVCADLDANGAIDLYVANDLNANSLFLNDGQGHFRDASESSGAAYDYMGTVHAGMGVDAEDTDGDGRPELIVTNFANEHNCFFRNVGKGFFQDVTQEHGLYAESLPWVGWGTAFTDFNLDGWLDLIVTNGHVDDNREGIPYAQPPLLWKNNGGRFTFIGAQAGDYFAQHHAGRALVVADLDNDGDQDVVLGHQDAAPALLENLHRTTDNRHAQTLVLRLIGTQCNRDAIGSTVTLRTPDYVRVLQVKGGGSYLSAHDPRKFFALPENSQPVRIEIRWADGSQSATNELPGPGTYTVIQPPSAATRLQVIWQRNQND